MGHTEQTVTICQKSNRHNAVQVALFVTDTGGSLHLVQAHAKVWSGFGTVSQTERHFEDPLDLRTHSTQRVQSWLLTNVADWTGSRVENLQIQGQLKQVA